MEMESRGWILIVLLVALGVGIFIWFASAADEEAMEARRDERILMEQEQRLHAIEAENAMLRDQLEAARQKRRR